ncbi:hypothetical protein DOS62_08395 [Staphylococcus felis]|nr:hypothetical protein DOS62_08395 [Staphylococcus felis]
MKLLMYGLNILNYIVLLLLIILNSHNLQQIGLNICGYFLFESSTLSWTNSMRIDIVKLRK